MRWRSGRRSSNVQDRRGRGGMVVGGGLGAIVITVVALLLGVDPDAVTTATGGAPAGEVAPGSPDQFRGVDEEADFISVVLADTEDTWNALFAESGSTYREPELVLFEDVVQSACGMAQSAVGPFYCPADEQVYLDLSFFRELSERFGAPGEFARAYVVAHEVGHHVQTLLGISDEVRAAQAGASQTESNAIQVRMELQADCFAGVWAHHAQRQRQVLEPGDIEDALRAASAIGDDRLQRETQGRVVPESFTHGTSAQRSQWFRNGFESGNPDRCDTFAM
ncbi:MAG TPA: neutral zinc metallopeptidase [Longimicrobiales bacterium]|nr:neutral zinc metallopeptidase [Longimicrobiales bacterium]